jgi:hypothetical protein
MPFDPDLTADGAAKLVMEIRQLAAEYQARLEILHDDSVHTRMLWAELLVAVMRNKRQLRVHNAKTGSVLTGLEMANTARNSINRLGVLAFKDMIGHFELFLNKALHLWLSANPSSLAKKALNVQTILACKTLEEAKSTAIAEAVESKITDAMHGKPEVWFKWMEELLDTRFASQQRETFIEMKARRDVLEHSGGVVTGIYLKKVQSAARYVENDRVEISRPDVDETFDVVHDLISKVADAASGLLAKRQIDSESE